MPRTSTTLEDGRGMCTRRDSVVSGDWGWLDLTNGFTWNPLVQFAVCPLMPSTACPAGPPGPPGFPGTPGQPSFPTGFQVAIFFLRKYGKAIVQQQQTYSTQNAQPFQNVQQQQQGYSSRRRRRNAEVLQVQYYYFYFFQRKEGNIAAYHHSWRIVVP